MIGQLLSILSCDWSAAHNTELSLGSSYLSILRCDWCRISLQLPEQEAASSTIVVFKSFENLGCIINGQQSCHTPNYDEQRQVRWQSVVVE